MEHNTEDLGSTLLTKERRVAHHGLRAINFSFKEASVDPFGTGGIIEDELNHASAFRVVHKQDGAGCLHPAEFWPLCSFMCPVLKLRTVDWITENALVINTPIFLPFYPLTCTFCTTHDITRLRLLDRSPFHPYCEGLGSPFGAVGYANEEDLSDFGCCNCIDCYRRVLKPCIGEVLVTVPCENGSRGFRITTQWCLLCVIFPLGVCMADSKAYREELIQQVALAQGKPLTDNQRTVLPPRLRQKWKRWIDEGHMDSWAVGTRISLLLSTLRITILYYRRSTYHDKYDRFVVIGNVFAQGAFSSNIALLRRRTPLFSVLIGVVSPSTQNR